MNLGSNMWKWKPLQKSPPYFITCFKETEDEYYIGVTNYQSYWTNDTSKLKLLVDLEESNDGLEFDDENELFRRGLDMISNPETLEKVTILQEVLGKLLTVTMIKVYEFPLKWELALVEDSADHYFSAVIQPLLKTVCDLRSSQHELRELLIKKDKEIEEYKIEGKAPRRLITTVYDDAAHMGKHNTYEEYFGASGVLELLEATSNQKNQTPQSQTTASTTPANKKEQKMTTQSTELQFPKDSDINLPTVCKIPEKVTEVEKCSQNTPVDEKPSIVPTQIEETEIPKFEVSTGKLKKSAESESETKSSLQKRRRTNQLNY